MLFWNLICCSVSNILYSRADKFYHDSFVSSYEYGITLHAYPQNARITDQFVPEHILLPVQVEFHSQKKHLTFKAQSWQIK